MHETGVLKASQRRSSQHVAAQGVTDPSRCSAHDRLPLQHAALSPAAACAASRTLAHLHGKLSDLSTTIWMNRPAAVHNIVRAKSWSGAAEHLPQAHAIQDEHVCRRCCHRHPMGAAARSATPGRQPPETKRRSMQRLQVYLSQNE
jgi:hypothetical protein